MPRLILLNGVPGSGKSTLARRYVDEHPLVLALELDALRSMLGGWMDRLGESGRTARRMALEVARVQLGAKREVIVPQYLGRLDFILDLEALCAATGAHLVEVALLSGVEEATARFAQRSRRAETEAHRLAHEALVRSGDDIAAMYGRLVQLVESRPWTLRVTSVPGDIDGTYRRLVERLAESDGRPD